MNRIYTQIKYCLIFVACSFAMHSCNLINKHEQTPTYVHVDSFHFLNPAIPRSLSHLSQIKEVWAYYDNNLIGVFDLPCTIPVMTNSDTLGKLTLAPGIAVDGLNNLLGVYPFYRPDTSSLRPQPGKIINYAPATEFYSDAKITPLSSFAGGNSSNTFKLYGSGVPMEEYTDSIIGPAGIVNFLASTNDTVSENYSVDSLIIPLSVPAYIEFDYKSTVPFYIGLEAYFAGITSDVPLSGIAPSDHWQKFYLSVADFEAQYTASYYFIHIKASLPPGEASGSFEIANIQLVTF